VLCFDNGGFSGSFPGGIVSDRTNKGGVLCYWFIPPMLITQSEFSDAGGGIRFKTGFSAGGEASYNRIHDVDQHAISGLGSDIMNLHHNVAWACGEEVLLIESRNDGSPQGDVRNTLIWNNTIGESDATGIFFRGNLDDGLPSNEGAYSNCSVFNNIVILNNGGGVEMAIGIEEISSCPAGQGEICGLYWNYNTTYDPGSSTGYLRWYHSANFPTANNWTVAQLQANTVHGDNDTREDPLLTDPANGEFTLSASSPASVRTGGRGDGWPTYRGAEDPNADICVSITQNLPTNNDTIQIYTATIDMDFFDTDGDTLDVVLIGERGDATPEDTLADTVLIADDDWVWSWTGLTEDSSYYRKVIACDTAGCCDTSPVFRFHVDSIPPVVAGTGIIRGTSRGTMR